jgi:hypothetical protein
MTTARAKPAVRRPRRTEEDDVLRAIIELCVMLGYMVFHDNDPVRNRAGFPDLVIAGYGVLIILELKTDRNNTTPEQRQWIAALASANVDVRVYRTSAWPTGQLANELKTIKRNWTNTHQGAEPPWRTTRNSPTRPRSTSTPTWRANPRGGRAATAAAPKPDC